MIQIQLIEENYALIPARELTQEEKETVIFTLFDGENVNYYQIGDDLPIIEY